MNRWRRISALVAKEFLAILKDPKSRFVIIGPPIIQFFVFGYAATFDLKDVAYAVLDQDRSEASRALLAAFEGSPNFRLTRTLMSEQEMDAAIDVQDVRLVLRIPQDFSRRLEQGSPAGVQVILDGRNSNVAGIAQGYIAGIVERFTAERGGPGIRLEMIDRAWFNPNLESRWYMVSGLPGVICMVVVMLLTSLSVAREREQGTFDQLLVAPFSSVEILLGKSIPPLVFGLCDGLLLSAAAVAWFHIPLIGSLGALALLLSIFMLSVVGLGLLISSLCMTMQQALLGSFIAIMPCVILSGLTTPIENMPEWLQFLTRANPLRYAIAGLRGIFLRGYLLDDVLPLMGPMLIIALGTLSFATWMFRHRSQ